VISLARMNRVLAIDADNGCAVVQPGVVNLDLSKLTEPYGLFFAPDPSSQKASTIGGNIANNAGGPHCLSLGVTVNHVLGVEVVVHDGSVVRLGGKGPDGPGLDLTGVVVGSEGTLGIVIQATVRPLPLPEAGPDPRARGRDRRTLQPADRQSVPCWRWQPAPDDPVRRTRAGHPRSGHGGWLRNPDQLHRHRRHDHRRARRRPRKADVYAA